MYSSVRRCYTGLLAVFLLVLWSPTASAELRLASWNVLHGGWDNDKAMNQVAHIANHFDFLALQEVMNETFMEDLEASLETTSGESWSWMTSHTVGRSSYKEMYAFLYRDSAVEYDKGAVVFLDNGDNFARDPYSAQFRSRDSGHLFAVGTVHVVFGDSISDRLPELDALADYWGWLDDTYPEATVLLTGDFNMPPEHAGWAHLRQTGATPSIISGASTLATTEGNWSNLYDNIWHSDPSWEITDRGILAFPDIVPLSHVESRSRISDHAPVYVGLDGARVSRQKMNGKLAGTAPAKPTRQCIDLNKATAKVLDRLPNIGPARAQAIIQGRPWDGVSSLTRIRGLGPGRVGDIRDSGMTCSAPAP